jgi:hypothetical protein
MPRVIHFEIYASDPDGNILGLLQPEEATT